MTKTSTRRLLLVAAGMMTLLAGSWRFGHAADPLPYVTRTLGYSGQSTTLRGDVRTLGLAGATLGMPDTIQSTLDNPAGFAALGTGVAAELAINTSKDLGIQTESLGSLALGAGINNYPWAFSITTASPRSEGQVYTIGAADRRFEARVDEVRVTLGRVLWDRVSLGVGLGLLTGSEQLDTFTSQANGFRASGGLLVRLPGQFLFGASIHSASTLAFSAWDPIAGLSGFFQNIQLPLRAGLGLAWIPNRFFRGGFSLDYFGPHSGVALIRSEADTLGYRPTFQPRLGVSYSAIDLRSIDVQVSAGTYFEMSRTTGQPDRLHVTAGLEFKPWVLFFAWGMDVSYNYSSHVFAGGIDVLKLLSRLGALPREYRPPLGGVFPRISHRSDIGLPRFLVENWDMDPRSRIKAQSIEAIGDHFRDSFGESLENTPDEFKDLGEGFVQDLKDVIQPKKPVTSPKARPKSRPRPGTRPKTSKPKRPS